MVRAASLSTSRTRSASLRASRALSSGVIWLSRCSIVPVWLTSRLSLLTRACARRDYEVLVNGKPQDPEKFISLAGLNRVATH